MNSARYKGKNASMLKHAYILYLMCTRLMFIHVIWNIFIQNSIYHVVIQTRQMSQLKNMNNKTPLVSSNEIFCEFTSTYVTMTYTFDTTVVRYASDLVLLYCNIALLESM